MTLRELRLSAMFQSNNDEEDLGEFMPSLDDYINEGYDKLVEAYADKHLDPDEDEYNPLVNERDEPELPSWCHRAIADYATYMIYRNGNVTKQNRAMAYLQLFNEMLMKVREAGAKFRNGGNKVRLHGLYDRNNWD